MEMVNPTRAESLIEILTSQAELILAMILRPVIQRQIGIFLLILLFCWLVPEGIRRWRKTRAASHEEPQSEPLSRSRRWLTALYQLLTPILALVLLNIAISIFAQQGQPNGLLAQLTNLIWYWLIYRVFLTFLYARYGYEEVRPYRNRIISPLFVLLLIFQLVDIVPGSAVVAEETINLGLADVPLNDLVAALIVFYLIIVSAWIIEQMMIHSLPDRLKAEPGVIESFSTLARYTILALGFIIFLGMLGLDFTSLAIVAGGLSVGIGIGLQDIVANFISGIVLLFEQSLRPGDVIELEERISQVEKISLRATTVRTRTNEELIIPNASFTTNQVKNLTKSDRLIRIVVPFGVSYKSDPEVIRQLAMETGLKHPLVLPDPAPVTFFKGYGDSSIDFELRVSVNRPELMLIIRSDLYYMLWKVLEENNIEIPFPQRDLNMGDGWEKLSPDLQTEA